ncbi:MAG: helix-hairpin-helix domain-containing protein [Candidatus Sumerlaeia bacterium]|nr:helix-hairpin-helix domain-containing protein [Candidatus Sumerlaeia bacterium]
MADDPRRRWFISSGMTRREQHVLVFLIVLVGAGLAWHQYKGSWRREPLTLHRADHASSEPSSLPSRASSSRTRLPSPAAFRSATTATLEGPLDLNTASEEQLQTLPGIGVVRAKAIISHRESHGPFRRLEDLKQVPGIGNKTFEALRPYLKPLTLAATATLTTAPSPPTAPDPPHQPAAALPVGAAPSANPPQMQSPPLININTATPDQLAELDGIGEALAKRIVDYRRTYGPFRSPVDIQKVQAIGKAIYAKNRHRITVGVSAGKP